MAVDNKRIAKNTAYLYFRMLATMLVGLYTSRVILQNLGVTDYGVYGVVGGIVGFMGFLNGALATSSSRFLTYALGEGFLGKSQKTFATTLTIHIILGFVIFLIGEAIGPWMIAYKLLIPPERVASAQWAFQFSILTTAIGVSQVPYSATIVAHEKMNIYAYMAIVDILLRLAIATSLSFWGGDKLIFFSALLFLQSVGIMIFYRFYCAFKFKEAVFKLRIDKKLFRQISGFSGWSFVYQFVYALSGQGITILMGIFFSPAIVAARSISLKVNQMATQFIGNFRQAMNPQIVKLYAAREYMEFRKLTLRSGLYSFYIMWIMTLPMCLLASQLLGFWLKEVPQHTDIFCVLIMIDSLFWLFDTSFNQGIVATGDIKNNTIYSCIINVFRFPVIYIFFKNGGNIFGAFYISILFSFISGCILKPWLLIKQCKFCLCDFIIVYYNCMKVVLLSLVVPVLIFLLMPEATVFRFFIVGTFSVVSVVCTIYVVGISRDTRQKLNIVILRKLNRKR